ncbi:sodium- and chloride-dependent glycine transporter 1 [Teleopsis dalmanni]|uniref:sodium- and chloride-dependent glycine transporter 1 n=1 Tax=Teleopsis dalmanni TaxID=139649 RepID=UPI0018CE82CF|nr:sodium- and chloride-dependent glycine transporter 1 [Teleopsis dalmanni]XP_037958608.1 sodium- and chloride-dependent glycine transporter 1 [Teleopsis dalmanni]XP_037958609.1 sodium- and chloride-dependent glycine transporter 1 [Teleopsis dalmanni]
MKSICNEAKQHLSNCVLHDYLDDNDLLSPTLGYNSNTYSSGSGSNNNNSSFNHNNNHNNSANHNEHNNHSYLAATITAATTTSTYDTLQRPFKHDKRRGRWSTAADFYFACTSHAFGSIIFSELPVYGLLFGGVYFLASYIVAILLYAIPIFIIQTFLGQFSTSGTISAFRVAPIFKGIGYSILLLNLTSLAYYAVIAAVPFIYAAYSLNTVIPWMSCNNIWNTPNCSMHSVYVVEDEFQYSHATVEFFRYIISTSNDGGSYFVISWPVTIAVLGIWLVTLGILLKRVSFIGKLFRCVCILMLSFFIAIFAHLLLYVNISWSTLFSYFRPFSSRTYDAILSSGRAAIFMATWLLGPGWGSILTLASHNNFRHDSEKLTYWVSVTHIVLAVLAMICGRIALDHFEDHVGMFHYHVEEEHYMQFLYLCFAYLFGSFTSLPNFWSFLFFAMLFIAELSALIIQMMSVLTAIFDEHEKLRTKKSTITIGLVLMAMAVSVYFCTKQGFAHLHILPTLALLTHVTISIVLLLMTCWIYGRERFQCDLQFMLGKTISNFKIFLIRFVTPAFLVINIFQILFLLEQEESASELVIISQVIVYVTAAMYMIYKLCQTTGSLRNRLKQCFEPHDWHPVDADNRRFYEEVMGTSEMLVIDTT